MIIRTPRILLTRSRNAQRFVSQPPSFSMANLTTSKPVFRETDLQPKFSAGADESQLIAETNSLLERDWTLDEKQTGIRKAYYFKTYTKCQDFFNTIAIRSKSKNHHSTITVKFGSVHVHWTTHNPPGLSAKDTSMARYCDEQAKLIGVVDESQAQKCSAAPKSQS